MGQFKPSDYNHFIYIEEEDKYLIYNAISNGLAKLEPEIFNRLKEGVKGLETLEQDPGKKDLLQRLSDGNIIVDNDFDEIDFLRTRFNMGKFSQKTLSLTIVTTADCNMACVYCYQGTQTPAYAGKNLQDSILKFVEERIKSMGYKSLYVTWYGGEPLLNKDFIFSLSKKILKLCKPHNLLYGAMVVTNGTIMNKAIAKKLKGLKVGRMQITIDGPQAIHDRRRPIKNSKKSSYKLILENVKRVLGILPVQIRINVDKTNFSNTLELLENLERNGILNNNKDLNVYIGYTREWTTNCKNISHNCFSMKEFSVAEIEFQKMLIARGYSLGNLYLSPTGTCVSVSPHGYVIEPGGELHKCWSDVGNKEAYLGHVDKPVTFNKKLLKWLSFDPLMQMPECRACKLFPVCGGGCPYVAIKQSNILKDDKEYNCTPWKLFMEEKIQLFLKDKAGQLKSKI